MSWGQREASIIHMHKKRQQFAAKAAGLRKRSLLRLCAGRYVLALKLETKAFKYIEHRHLVVLPVNDSALYTDVWSGDTVNCKILMATGNILALQRSAGGYTAEVSIDCSRHNDRNSAAQLNFNGARYEDKVNLYAWCE